VHGHHPRGQRRQHVIVDPVADVGDPARSTPASPAIAAKNSGAGLATPRPADEATGSTPQLARRNRSTSTPVLPAAPTTSPISRSAAMHGSASG